MSLLLGKFHRRANFLSTGTYTRQYQLTRFFYTFCGNSSWRICPNESQKFLVILDWMKHFKKERLDNSLF